MTGGRHEEECGMGREARELNDCKVPDAEQVRILQRNGIDPDAVSVVLEDKASMVLLHHMSGDNIIIVKGYKP